MSQGQKVIKYLAIVFAACLTITILGVVLNIVVSIFGAFIPKSGESKAVKQYTETVSSNYSNTFNNVEQIRVDSGVYNVEIINDESIDGVKVVKEGVSNDLDVSYDEHDKQLVVEQEGFWNDLFKFNDKHQSKGKLLIYVEDGLELEKLDIDMGVGNSRIEGITTEELDIDCGVGNLTCKKVVAESTDIDGGVGGLKCEDISFRDLNLDGGVGEISIAGELLGTIQISAGMGELNVDINGKRDDYNLKVETGLGSIIIDGEKYTDTNNYNNNQSNLLDIEGGIGSIRIDFH